MPVFKDEKRGTWYVMAWYRDWTGARKQKCKRGFPTKRDAQDWEHGFKLQTCSDLDMTFEAFVELYTKDIINRSLSISSSRCLQRFVTHRSPMMPNCKKRKRQIIGRVAPPSGI